MNRAGRPVASGLALLAALATSACGGTGELHGVVTYAGKPLPGGTVVFVGPDNRPVRAPISPDGKYEARGVPAGPVKIAVLSPPPPPFPRKPGAPPAPPTMRIPPQYADPNTSGLSHTATTGAQQHDIDLK
jgi:hypothetical protein